MQLRSLRVRVMMGAVLWTIGLYAVIVMVLTFSTRAMRSVAVIHSHTTITAVVAVAAMIGGLMLVRGALAPLDRLRQRLSAVRNGTEHQLRGTYP
ncbi:MAG TPA: hypothetical protein VGX46_16025, partial [Vicinamibacterales bacterium]|nr:hypothetical protein [Vicinamibacterales bacterium]